MIKMIIFIVAYIILAPLIGGLFAGIDRKLIARMQGRVGPPVLQPFYDVLKLAPWYSRTRSGPRHEGQMRPMKPVRTGAASSCTIKGTNGSRRRLPKKFFRGPEGTTDRKSVV